MANQQYKGFGQRKPLHGDDDSDDWADFASFAEGPAKSLNVESQSNSTFLDLTSGTKSIATWPSKEKETMNGLDDAFDDWQDFTYVVDYLVMENNLSSLCLCIPQKQIQFTSKV